MRTKRSTEWFLILAAVFFLASASVLIELAPGVAGTITRTDVLKLQGKDRKSVVAGERHYMVTDETVIENIEGEAITLRWVPIPCKARVTYRLRMDEPPVAVGIKVEETYAGSTAVWSPSSQEER
jgi:CBS domain-containing protein